MKHLARTAAAASLAVSLAACSAQPPAPALAPRPAAVRSGTEAPMAPAPVLPASRLAAPAADVAPQTRRANGTRTGLIVLGVVAAVVVLYFAVGGGANTDY